MKSRIINVLNYKKPPFWIVIIAVVAVVCVGVGLMTNPQAISTGENDFAQEIYQYRTPYVGDNSRVGNIVDRLPAPKALTHTGVQLFTDSPPYSVEVSYQTTPAARKYFAQTDKQTVFDQNAVLMFVLNDGGQDLLIQRTRAWANEKMAKNVWESSATVEKFTALYADVTNKIVTPASLADLLVSGKKTDIQSVNDVPNAVRYKKAEMNGEVYYIYAKSGKYYVEKPYQSVEEITKEIYNKILKAIIIVNMLEPPKIAITAAENEINYTVGLNQWNSIFYDRENTFWTIMKGKSKTDVPYIKLNQEIQIKFEGKAPDSVRLLDYILAADGSRKYTEKEIQTIPIEFNNGKGSFVLVSNPAALLSSASSDYEPGASMRGFRLICKWGQNECEYAFIIRSDASPFAVYHFDNSLIH